MSTLAIVPTPSASASVLARTRLVPNSGRVGQACVYDGPARRSAGLGDGSVATSPAAFAAVPAAAVGAASVVTSALVSAATAKDARPGHRAWSPPIT